MQRLTMLIRVNRIPTLVLFHWSILLNRLVYRKALHEWSNAIDRLMTFLMDWYCLPVRVIDWNAEWLMQHMIDDRPWNPRNPNSMLRKKKSYHSCASSDNALLLLVGCLLLSVSPGPGNEEQLVCSFKTLKALSCSSVPRGFFLHPSHANGSEQQKSVKKTSCSSVPRPGFRRKNKAFLEIICTFQAWCLFLS